MLMKYHSNIFDNVTIPAKGEKHISRTGSNDKKSVTVTLCESYNGVILTF